MFVCVVRSNTKELVVKTRKIHSKLPHLVMITHMLNVCDDKLNTNSIYNVLGLQWANIKHHYRHYTTIYSVKMFFEILSKN